MRSIKSLFLVLAIATAAHAPLAAQTTRPLHGPSRAQGSSLLDLPAYTSLSDVPLAIALRQLQDRSEVPIAFSTSLIPAGHRVDCTCNELTVGEALERILAGVDLAFTPVGGQVVIVPKRGRQSGLTVVIQPAVRTVAGQVFSEETGEPVPNAAVFVPGTGRATLSDMGGRYQLSGLPPGEVMLRVQRIGFAAEARILPAAKEMVQIANFNLPSEALRLGSVEVSVGSRAVHTAADELAVPVDIFGTAEILSASRADLTEVLQELSPSINFDRPQIADLTAVVPPFQMRGLSPDHALVLINGKRRHPTAVVHVFGGQAIGNGSSGVDMSAIPSLAVRQLEILRDGAAAQYGSDAIAGVINMALKNTLSDPTFTATYGVHTPGIFWGGTDGQKWDISGNVGLPLLARGTLNLTGQITDRNRTNRACPDARDQIVYGDGDVTDWATCDILIKRNAVTQPNFLYGDGESENRILFYNADLPLGESLAEPTLYSFGGVSHRQGKSTGNYRRGIQNVNWPAMYPDGFLPTFDVVTADLMTVGGVRGSLGRWQYDMNGQFGRNRVDNDIINSLNTSLGPCFREWGDAPCAPGADGVLGTADDAGIPNQTSFYTGSLQLTQMAAELGASRSFDPGLVDALHTAWGGTYRREIYQILAGEPASYVDGGHRDQWGGRGAAGSQVFFGYGPEQTVRAERSNLGIFGDVEVQVSEPVLLALAGRYERYSDFGSTLTWKVAARFQPIQQMILRAAASSGFRAPSLSQSHYTHVSTVFRSDGNGESIPVQVGEFPATSPQARALGAMPLHEEKSRNYGIGMAVTPQPGLNFTADAYLIRVDDRIMLTNTLDVNSSTGEGRRIIEELLQPYSVTSLKYFMNAFNTRTAGVDLTGSYLQTFSQKRTLQLAFSYNYNQQALVGELATPDVLAGMGTVLYPEPWRIGTMYGRPQDRFGARALLHRDRVSVNLATHYYGEITSLEDENPYVLHVRTGKAIFDLDVSWELSDHAEITFGAENLLNTYPDRNLRGHDNGGRNPFPSDSWGRNGRFIYSRLTVGL